MDPNAAEVFYRIVSRISGEGLFIDDLVDKVNKDLPLLLLWGIKDPWIGTDTADRLQALFPASSRVNLIAGHCPHDEVPAEVNNAIVEFISSLS